MCAAPPEILVIPPPGWVTTHSLQFQTVEAQTLANSYEIYRCSLASFRKGPGMTPRMITAAPKQDHRKLLQPAGILPFVI